MRKRPPVCVNLYNQPSCSLQPNTFLSGTVPSRGVGRKDFFWLSTLAFLPFPHLRLHGPRSIQSPEVVPSQFRLQQERRCKHPTARGAPSHLLQNYCPQNTNLNMALLCPSVYCLLSDPKNGTQMLFQSPQGPSHPIFSLALQL